MSAVKKIDPTGKRKRGHEVVSVELSPDAMRYVRQLVHKGLYGATEAEVARTIVYEWLRSACEDGWVE